MYQKITNYVESIFSDVKDNSVTGFTKKGFISSITKKYEQNLAKGMTKEEAYDLAISQTPEILNVAKDMKKYMGKNDRPKNDDDCEFHYSASPNSSENTNACNKPKEKNNFDSVFSSIFWPIVVGVYFLISFLTPNVWAYSWTIFVGAAVVHCFVRIFFEKVSKKTAISSALWLLSLITYLVLSILTKTWQYTWIIFVVAAFLQCVLSTVTAKSYGERQAAAGGSVWLFVTSTYFILSFLTERWDVTWTVFIFGIAIHAVVKLIVDKNYKEN